MAEIIRIITYPLLVMLRKTSQQFSIVNTIIVITIALFLIQHNNTFYKIIMNEVSGSPLNNKSQTVKKITIKKGDTLSEILYKQQLPQHDIQKLIKLAKNEVITSNLKIGQVISFLYNKRVISLKNSTLIPKNLVLSSMSLQLNKNRSIEFVRTNETEFQTHHIITPLKKVITKYKTKINSSVIASLQSVGMSTNSITDLINAYSHPIDFERQIQPGDTITIIAEKFITSENTLSHHGKILYASLNTGGKKYNIYSYSHNGAKNNIQFFSEEGYSIKSNLLRTPVDIVRISGTFGYRKKHPVLGYGTMHKGVDFAAAVGTPHLRCRRWNNTIYRLERKLWQILTIKT
jgi:murein DD-endopeptidase MepM/ murein hydrolase activator NlpD